MCKLGQECSKESYTVNVSDSTHYMKYIKMYDCRNTVSRIHARGRRYHFGTIRDLKCGDSKWNWAKKNIRTVSRSFICNIIGSKPSSPKTRSSDLNSEEALSLSEKFPTRSNMWPETWLFPSWIGSQADQQTFTYPHRYILRGQLYLLCCIQCRNH